MTTTLCFAAIVCILVLGGNTVLGAADATYNYCRHQPNVTDDLAFVNPKPLQITSYPMPLVVSTEGRLQILSCCGTGFTYINWFINGEFIGPFDPRFKFYEDRQALHWLKASPAGKNNVTCELIKNSTKSIEHRATAIVIRNCVETNPYFTIPPKRNQCVSPGDNVTLKCEMHFGDDKCLAAFFKAVYFFDANGTFLSSEEHEDYPNVEQGYLKGDEKATIVLGTLTFRGITAAQLNRSYYCTGRNYEHLRADFEFLTNCQEEEKKTVTVVQYVDEGLATKIAIPILVVLCVAILATALIYVYRIELMVLWNTHIRPSNKGSNAYDGYVICSKDESDHQFLVQNLMNQLEQFYKLCIPDRDFIIGSIIPEQMTEHVKNSKRVVVITSASMLQTDYCDLSLSVAIANKIPIIFIKPNYDASATTTQKDGEGNQLEELLSERPEVTSTIAVSDVLTFPKEVTDVSLSQFYNSLYNAMPLANKKTVSTSNNVFDRSTEEKLA